jgi:hypothetical protein
MVNGAAAEPVNGWRARGFQVRIFIGNPGGQRHLVASCCREAFEPTDQDLGTPRVSIRRLGTISCRHAFLPDVEEDGASKAPQMLEGVPRGGSSSGFFQASSLLVAKIQRRGEGLAMLSSSFYTS